VVQYPRELKLEREGERADLLWKKECKCVEDEEIR